MMIPATVVHEEGLSLRATAEVEMRAHELHNPFHCPAKICGFAPVFRNERYVEASIAAVEVAVCLAGILVVFLESLDVLFLQEKLLIPKSMIERWCSALSKLDQIESTD